MPIKSYLAYPHDGQKSNLIERLSKVSQCDIVPAKNEDLLIVVTDTESREAEESLRETLEAIESLKLLVMVSGFDTNTNN